MKIFESRKLTDAEFVERTRKQLQKSRRWAWICLIGSGMFVAFFFWFFYIVIDMIGGFWNKDSAANQHLQNSMEWYRIGLATGACLGGFAMLLLVKAFWYFCEFLMMLSGNRRDKLLVAYYDQLHPLDAKAPAPSNAGKFSN
jgi:hypothetical protein